MQFRCERDELHKTIQAVAGVVASKGVHPVYESVKIVAEEDSLTLLATDLEIGMRVIVGPSETLEVKSTGTAVVPAQRLGGIFRELPRGAVSFAWDPERREAVVESGRTRFQLQGQSPEDFPEIPEVDPSGGVTLAAGALRQMVRRTAFAAAKERMRFALNGVLLKVAGGEIEVVATDGRRLARDVAGCTNETGCEVDAIVPTKGLLQLDRNLGDLDADVRIAVGNNHFSGSTGNVTVVSRLVEGSFPPYQDVIPKDCEMTAVLPRDGLTAALKRVSLVTSRDAQSVRMQFEPGALKVSARSAEGQAEESLACNYTGEEQTVGFNPSFVVEVLNVLTEDDVSFGWNGKASPGRLTEGSYTYVVMPVSIE